MPLGTIYVPELDTVSAQRYITLLVKYGGVTNPASATDVVYRLSGK